MLKAYCGCLQKKKRDDAEVNGAAAEPEQKKKKRKAADTVADTAETLAAIAAAPLPVQVSGIAFFRDQRTAVPPCSHRLHVMSAGAKFIDTVAPAASKSCCIAVVLLDQQDKLD